MKLKRLFMLAIGAAFLLTSAGKPVAVANEINKINENVTQQVMRLANSASDEEDTEDPEEILSRAIEDYKEEFDSYIDITGLNVDVKESITLPEFNINYVAPTYGEVMHEYQLNLEISLTTTQLERYDDLRRADFTFDKYVALNQNKYLDLTIPPKYGHITTMAVVTTALVGILSSAGLTQAAISAFTGAVGTLSAAISTSWIPFIGWVLAVGLAVGALIALTVIIVQYWEQICSVFEDIKNWFAEQFSAFAYLINSYFDDAKAKVEESSNVGTVTVGNKELTFQEVETRDVAAQAALVKKARWTDDIFLMRYVSKNDFQICHIPVSFDFCVEWGTHRLGLSSYTWYQNKARSLILYAGSGVTTNSPEIDFSTDSDAIFMKHFHNCEVVNGQIVRIKTQPMHWTHSFFGQLYYYPTGSNDPIVHPDSPNPNPNA